MWLPDENENEQLRRALSPLSPPATFSLLIVLKYFSYFSSPFFLLNLPYISPVKLLSPMRLTTSELTNLVGEFLELTYTWPLSSRRLSCIWIFSSPRLMLRNTFPITSQCGRRFSTPFISFPLAKHLILEFFLFFFFWDVLDFSHFTFIWDDFTYCHLSSTCNTYFKYHLHASSSDLLLQLCHLC